MANEYSRIDRKGRTTIPRAVRRQLGLATGDVIRFGFTRKDLVTISKANQAETDAFASFSEWASTEDEKLYADL